jgi:hypothetical protein
MCTVILALRIIKRSVDHYKKGASSDKEGSIQKFSQFWVTDVKFNNYLDLESYSPIWIVAFILL